MAVYQLNKAYAAVKKFHEACGVDMPDTPTLLSGAGEEVNKKWFIALDFASNTMKSQSEGGEGSELLKRISYIIEETAELANADTLEDQADALTDLIYFALGTFTLIGVQPEAIFDIVQAANMGKTVNGKVWRDDQGKIKKPQGWYEKYAPEVKIEAEIERQAAEGQDYQYPRVWKD